MTFACDELHELTRAVAAAWRSAAGRDWSVPAGSLEWSCTRTADHAVDTVLAPAFFLASRKQDGYPEFEPFTLGAQPRPETLVEGLETATRILSAVVSVAEPEARAVIWYRPEVEVRGPADFVPRGALELILHAHDVCTGLDVPFAPPEEVCERLRHHTRSWPLWRMPGWTEPTMTDDPWADLLRASGRQWRGRLMRRLPAVAVVLTASVLIAACSDGGAAATEPVGARLQRTLDAAVHDLDVTSASVEVIVHDGTRITAASGTDTATKFGIASITKTFTTVTVLRLAERGIVDLDAEVTLPGLDPGATLRDLLGHTTGLPYAAPLERSRWSAVAFEAAASAPHPCRPHDCFAYSDLGFVGVGLVVEQATGEPFADVLGRELLVPLDLDDTVLTTLGTAVEGVALPDGEPLGPPGPLAGVPVNTWTAGSLVTTAVDLARFARALFDGELLEPASLAQMTDMSRTEALPCDELCFRPYGLGLEGYRVADQEAWGHGASTGAQLAHFPGEGITVAIVTSRQGTGGELLSRVIAAVTEG